jgi:hypothetical protein
MKSKMRLNFFLLCKTLHEAGAVQPDGNGVGFSDLRLQSIMTYCR